MGLARVSCLDGCSCDTQTIDARHNETVSVGKMHSFPVSHARRCRLQIVNLGSGTGEPAKWKLLGMVVSTIGGAPPRLAGAPTVAEEAGGGGDVAGEI